MGFVPLLLSLLCLGLRLRREKGEESVMGMRLCLRRKLRWWCEIAVGFSGSERDFGSVFVFVGKMGRVEASIGQCWCI